MTTNHYLTAKEVLARTHIPYYQLDYFVRIGTIRAETFGSGIQRKFSFSVIKEINNILKKRGVENEN